MMTENECLPILKYPEQKGLVSVIVPIYNNETYLRECLNSIWVQSFKNWEAILVNDGSTDNTGKIIDEYVERDSRFVAIHKQNEGTLLARKTGLENSRGEFIANIDHDDTYNLDFLAKMYAKIMETGVDFVWCKCQTQDMQIVYCASNYEWSADASENVANMLIPGQGITVVTWNKLIKREIYSKTYFPCKKIILGEDLIQTIQIAYNSKSAEFISENLYFHRSTGFSTAPKSINVIQGIANIIDEVYENPFKGIVPESVIKTLCLFLCHCNTVRHFFRLERRQRYEFEKTLKLFLPTLIKLEKKQSYKACLFLANKGITFPFLLLEKLYNPLHRRIRSFGKRILSYGEMVI